MTIDLDSLELHDNPAAGRLEVPLGDTVAEVQYMRVGNTLIFTHTEVPEAYEGRGIGNRTAQMALEYARSQGLRVRSICPFMSAFLARHRDEYEDILVHVGGR